MLIMEDLYDHLMAIIHEYRSSKMKSESFVIIIFFNIPFYRSEDDDPWDDDEDWSNTQPDNSEIIQREIVINNVYAGIIIGRLSEK
jgi:hypothetical protein